MGWGVDPVREIIAELDLVEQIHFTGYIPPEDLPFVYNLADLFVYPSLYEGFGLPPLEALACGIPQARASRGGRPNMGEAAILVPPADEKALSSAIRQILSDPILSLELANKGPLQAAKFKWETTARQTLAIYQQVLQNR